VKERIEELAVSVYTHVAGDGLIDAIEKVIAAAVNEALELAARECARIAGENEMRGHMLNEALDTGMHIQGSVIGRDCAAAIRKMKVQ